MATSRIWSVLKVTLLGLLGVLCLIVGAALFLIRFPQMIFQSEWVENELKKQEFAEDWSWESFDIDLRSDSFLTFRIRLDIENFHFDYALTSMIFDLKASKLSAEYEVSLAPFSGMAIELRAMAPLVLDAQSLLIQSITTDGKVSKINGGDSSGEALLWKESLNEFRSNFAIEPQVNFEEIVYKVEDSTLLRAEKFSFQQDTEKNYLLKTRIFPSEDKWVDLSLLLKEESLDLALNGADMVGVSSPKCFLSLNSLSEVDANSEASLKCETGYQNSYSKKHSRKSLKGSLLIESLLDPRLGDEFLRRVDLRLEAVAPSLDAKISLKRETPMNVLSGSLKDLLGLLAAQLKGRVVVKDLKRTVELFSEAPSLLNVMNGSLVLDLENSEKNSYVESRIQIKMDLAETSSGKWTSQKEVKQPLKVSLDLVSLLDTKIKNDFLRAVDFKFKAETRGLDAELVLKHESPLDVARISLNETARTLAPKMTGKIGIKDLKKFLKTFGEVYGEAPAPFNVMNGSLVVDIDNSANKEFIETTARLKIDLRGEGQRIDLGTLLVLPWKFDGNDQWKMDKAQLDVKLNELTLILPKVSPTQPLPMLVSDSRFKKESNKESIETIRSESKKKKNVWDAEIHTEEPIVLKTSLIDEDIRLAVNLNLNENGIDKGSVEILPLKMEIFKRPIELQKFVIRWLSSTSTDLLGKVLFRLPEYQIYLRLEGTLDSPRIAFESDPPLNTDDIYSVLLFGRPMTELDLEGKQGMSRVQQGLAQGLFSLSTLYLLAGTRIESLGYNPATSEVSASVRLDSKHSVRVGAQDGSRESVALRRSLGGGWFIESKAQQTGPQNTDATDFGLMLQRVIAY